MTRILVLSSQFEIYGCKKQVRWAQISPHGAFAAPLLMQSHSRLTTVMHFLIQWAHPPQKCGANRNNLPRLCAGVFPSAGTGRLIGVDCMKCHAPSPLPALLDSYERLPLLLYVQVHVALVWCADLSTLWIFAIKPPVNVIHIWSLLVNNFDGSPFQTVPVFVFFSRSIKMDLLSCSISGIRTSFGIFNLIPECFWRLTRDNINNLIIFSRIYCLKCHKTSQIRPTITVVEMT